MNEPSRERGHRVYSESESDNDPLPVYPVAELMRCVS